MKKNISNMHLAHVTVYYTELTFERDQYNSWSHGLMSLQVST